MAGFLVSPHIACFALSNQQSDLALFAYQLTVLPDFLADHTLLGQTPAERLEEVLSRFEHLVIGLRKYRKSAFSLRFISFPDQGRVDVHLIGRLVAETGQAAQLAAQAATDISAHLTSYGLPHEPLLEKAGGEKRSGLAGVLMPFEKVPSIVEIRQHEQIVPLHTTHAEAYVIHPFWCASGAGIQPFEVMLRQPFPVVLSIYLEPTEVTDVEYNVLSEAAHIAQTMADLEVKTYSDTGIRRRRDPGAELIGQIYSAYLQSLSDPFIMTVQAASPDPNTAWTIARAAASAMTATRPGDTKNFDQGRIPTGADFFTPANQNEYSSALSTFQHLLWGPWGKSLATANKERLPYLLSARAATTAFRFPISVQGGVPGITVRQMPPDFEPGPRPDKPAADEIHLGSYHRGGAAVIRMQDLKRHALVTGFTGSGKTNTVIYLLDQIWRQHKTPFLVIEAAKKEYRSLARVPGFEDLLIFTLGDETSSPFRFNPFELIPGVRLEAHLGRLQACFDAALPQFGILPSIIAEAMEEIYRDKGWKLTDRAEENPTHADPRLFPTLREMFTAVIRIAERRGYAGETFHNIRAAAAGRIGSLLRGSKGRMFGSQRSFPVDVLFNRPVIFELNDLNEDDKALMMMFILTWLREYREQHPGKQLQHLTVVEEAHNVLSNVQSVGASEVSADTKAKAVGAFANMLAEVRSYGEGILISDQSPEKLAPDAMRNTNLQIAHQLRDQRDREAIARAMIMDDSQRDYLGKLRIGEAALFYTGIEKATFIRIPEFKDSAGFDTPLTDSEVAQRMQPFQKQHYSVTLPFDGCRFCASACRFREIIEPQTLNREIHQRFLTALKRFDEQPQPEHRRSHWREIAGVCSDAARLAAQHKNLDAAYCYLAHEIDFPFTPHMRRSFEQGFAEVTTA